jgi:hypothetical protein
MTSDGSIMTSITINQDNLSESIMAPIPINQDNKSDLIKASITINHDFRSESIMAIKSESITALITVQSRLLIGINHGFNPDQSRLQTPDPAQINDFNHDQSRQLIRINHGSYPD